MYKALIAQKDSGCKGLGYDHYTFGKPGDDLNGGFYIRPSSRKNPEQLDLIIEEFDEDLGEAEMLIGEDLRR